MSKQALETIDQLAELIDLSDYISRITHPLVRTIDKNADLRDTAMDTLCSLVTQLGRKFCIFVPMVQKVVTKHKINHRRLVYARLSSILNYTSMDLQVGDFGFYD